MYKFTNGIVVFDKKTRDAYLKAGFKLMATGDYVFDKKLFKNQEEELNGNKADNDTIVKEEHTTSNTKTSKNRK